MDWGAFTEACRALSTVRQGEAERRARDAEQTGTLRSELERLKHRLTVQRDRLAVVGKAVKLTPSFAGVTRSGTTDIGEAVRQGFATAEHADAAVGQAEERARKPRLLPGMGILGRNVLVYVVFAFGWWIVGVASWLISPATAYGRWPPVLTLWNSLGLPALAVLCALATIHLAGRPLIGDGGPQGGPYNLPNVSVGVRTQSGRRKTASTKGDPTATANVLGGLICLLGMNLGYCLAFGMSVS